MSLDPVLSLHKSISVVGCEEVLLKIFDLEHFGVLIQATVTSALTTGTPTEYTLGVTERQVKSIESSFTYALMLYFSLLNRVYPKVSTTFMNCFRL